MLWLLQKREQTINFRYQSLILQASADITIKKNEVIGKLQLVSSIVSLPVKQLKSTDSEQSYKLKHAEPTFQTSINGEPAQKHVDHKARELTNTEDQQLKKEHIEKVISQINLSSLTEQQKGSSSRDVTRRSRILFSVRQRCRKC